MNALIWLVVFLVIGLNSGCALAMGTRRSCERPSLPVRPVQELCIANSGGGGGCYDVRRNPSKYDRDSILNYVCSPSDDIINQEVWIKSVLDSCRGN